MDTILLTLRSVRKEDLKQIALKENRSVNSYINQAIKEKLERVY